ncbi:Crp/Fnr family transcriptional regulator [Aureispira anguillae]|uniref:Crp/Fnr family transcriptional regulator n=1 Tax=Aureispira anguillae TaxID=2864201 RepID=A0A916DS63_9BACT|nr:Crp/Fnr family transcriptional regulator [Aureispira anguillae]BDS12309.1 Crp/Fnr family transcriptional regulator [Aureispira anguillae]
MIEQFILRIKEYISVQEEEVAYLRNRLVIKRYKKDEIIFSEGEVARTIYFVLDGCVRLFYNVKGNYKTAFFYTEGKFICAGESYNLGTPARENYQAIEDTVLVHFDKKMNEELVHQFPVFGDLALIVTEQELIAYQKILASFITKSPEERYLELLAENGALFLRVQQQYIASYLGVTPETLSRIKKRIAQK